MKYDVNIIFTYNIPDNKHSKNLSIDASSYSEAVSKIVSMFPTTETLKITERETQKSTIITHPEINLYKF